MIILEKYKFLEKLVGMNPVGRIGNIILRTIYLDTLISFNLMETIFIILNIRDSFEQAATALSPLCGVLPAMANYMYLLINREEYFSLSKELQDVVSESKQNQTIL